MMDRVMVPAKFSRSYGAAFPKSVLYRNRTTGQGCGTPSGHSGAIGDFEIIQDADLENNPLEHQLLLQPLIDGEEDVVYGSRLYRELGLDNAYQYGYESQLSDMETCYKVFPAGDRTVHSTGRKPLRL
jgi:hypothetical protein